MTALSARGGRPTGSRGVSMAPRERLWTPFSIVTSYGPLTLPPVEELRRAASALADAWPALRLGHLVDAMAGRWHLPVGTPGDVGAAVVLADHGPSVAEVGTSEHLRRVAGLRPEGVPLCFVVSGGGVLSVLMSHALGDAGIVTGSVRALLETALTGDVPAWVLEPVTPRPLRAALRRRFVDDPHQLLRTVRAAQPRFATSGGGGRPGLVRADSDAVHRVMTQGTVRELRDWRAANAPGVSMVALQAVLLERAFHQAGLPRSGVGPTVLFDARRYLPRGSVVHGNFVAGIRLDVTGRWDVREIHDAIQGAADAARPLTAMTMGAVLSSLDGFRRGRQPAAGQRLQGQLLPFGSGSGPVVAVSSVRTPALRTLPWAAAPDDRMIASLITAAPANGVTLSATELEGCQQLSLSFHRSVIETRRMQAALDMISERPTELLGATT